MMNVKTQSPVYVNKKEVSYGDFYVNASGKTKKKKQSTTTETPGPWAPSPPAPEKKKVDIASVANKGYLADTIAGAKNLFGMKGDTNTTVVAADAPAPDSPMSTGAKIGIAVAVAAVIGIVIYVVRKK